MRMRVCYLDSHEGGLCCYLVIHIETLLRPLQLFYFHLWPIYWLSLVFAVATGDQMPVLADYVWLGLVSSKQTMRVQRRISASAKWVHESFKSASVVTPGRVRMLCQVQPSGCIHGQAELSFRIVART
jgi:hypothetical protein